MPIVFFRLLPRKALHNYIPNFVTALSIQWNTRFVGTMRATEDVPLLPLLACITTLICECQCLYSTPISTYTYAMLDVCSALIYMCVCRMYIYAGFLLDPESWTQKA